MGPVRLEGNFVGVSGKVLCPFRRVSESRNPVSFSSAGCFCVWLKLLQLSHDQPEDEAARGREQEPRESQGH